MVDLTIVAAIGENLELGYRDDLVWKISEDLKNFKQVTLGHHLLMGRKTFESIGRPLPGRVTLVLSRSQDLHIPGVEVVTSVDEALEYCEARGIKELMICGGGELYAQMISKAKNLFISHIHASSKADTFFPVISTEDWHIQERTDYEATSNKPAWSFIKYQRRES
jgi:dihydrofolate reductase